MNPKMAHRSEQNLAFFKKLNSYNICIFTIIEIFCQNKCYPFVFRIIVSV